MSQDAWRYAHLGISHAAMWCPSKLRLQHMQSSIKLSLGHLLNFTKKFRNGLHHLHVQMPFAGTNVPKARHAFAGDPLDFAKDYKLVAKSRGWKIQRVAKHLNKLGTNAVILKKNFNFAHLQNRICWEAINRYAKLQSTATSTNTHSLGTRHTATHTLRLEGSKLLAAVEA